MDFNARVVTEAFNLNDTDDDIVEYINKYKTEIVKFSIHKVADDLFISPNSIMRFSKKLGYSGFSELKYSIKNSQIKYSRKVLDISEMMRIIPSNIVRTIEDIDKTMINIIIHKILTAKCCTIFGVGESDYFSEKLARNFNCFGKKIDYYRYFYDLDHVIMNTKEDDVFIFISESGETGLIIDLAKRVEDKRACIISITGKTKNRLVDLSNYNVTFFTEHKMLNNHNVTDRSGLNVLIQYMSEIYWKTQE